MKEKLKEMVRLYTEDEWTLEQIGNHFGITKQAVQDRFRRAGIKRRNRSIRPLLFDRNTLVELYENQKLTLDKIATQLGTNQTKIAQELKRHKIERRPRGSWQIKYSEFYQLKINEVIKVKAPSAKIPCQNLHSAARNAGIKVSVKRIDEDTFQITRIK